MATNYPTSLDTTTNLPSSPDPFVSGTTTGHLSHPPTAHGAIRALEAKLGIGSSTATGAATGYVIAKNADGTTSWQAQTLDPGGTGTYRMPAPLGSGSDDRAQLIAWLGSVPPANSTIQVRAGYLLSSRLPLPSGHRYIGEGIAEGAAPPHFKLMNGANPAAAIDGVVVSKEWDDNNINGGGPTIFENIAIDGNAANNTGTYSCMIPFNFWTRIRWCRMDNPRLHHIYLSKAMKNGSEATGLDFADNRIYGNRFREALTGTNGAGIRHNQPGGSANHNADVRVFDNHFESAQHGIWADSVAGWTIMDNHIWARRNAINIENGFYASQIIANYIDGFGNENTGGSTYYGIRVRGFEGNGCTVALNNVDITENITAATFHCYMLEAQNANAHIAGGLNRAFGHTTPNTAHHGFTYTANNGLIINGQLGNVAVGFVTGQDFEQSTSGGGSINMLYPRTVSATTTIDWASMAAGASVTNTITVTGAAVGDLAQASLTTLTDAGNIHITARVTAANTVSVTIRNDTAGTVNPTSGTLRATVWKYS